jgi:predicted nucleic acid-binding protein
VTDSYHTPEAFAAALQGYVAARHTASAAAPIRLPDPGGVFPADILLRPPPVVVDANILRNDILRACRTGQRTVLVTAANAGLLRLFCAEHVYQEVAEHAGDWTAGGPVTRADFLRRWVLEYLPLIRIVGIGEGHLGWLNPAELARVQHLARPDQDPDDVPSAVLALLLQAFFLSGDREALRAVYGDADLAEHSQWVNILKAGGDTGELAKLFTLTINLVAVAGQGLISGARRLADATSPWLLVAGGLVLAVWYARAPDQARQRVAAAGRAILMSAAGAAAVYEEVRQRFKHAAPPAPDWPSLAASNPPGAVLGRACLHTLGRSPRSDRSAAELAEDLPWIGVAQGEEKVRQTLRNASCFTEVWQGRWQAGYAAPVVVRYLQQAADSSSARADGPAASA